MARQCRCHDPVVFGHLCGTRRAVTNARRVLGAPRNWDYDGSGVARAFRIIRAVRADRRPPRMMGV